MVIFYDKSSRSRKIFIAPGPKRINIAHLPQNCPQGSQHCNLPSNCPLNRIEGPLPHMMSKLAKTNREPLHGISDVYVFVLLEAYSQASESTHLGWSDHFCTALRYLWLCLFEIGRRGALLPLLAITHAVVYLATRLSGPSISKLDLSQIKLKHNWPHISSSLQRSVRYWWIFLIVRVSSIWNESSN